MKRLKILILGDGLGWIVDRIVEKLIEGIPCDFTKRYYTQISAEEFLNLARQHDLVHYNNWAFLFPIELVDDVLKTTPLLLSIRSHRYWSSIHDIAKKVSCVHIVNPLLQKEFPSSVYIPDGIFEQFCTNKPFVVGFAGRPDEYKGFNLIKQACAELGVEFRPATGEIPPEKMSEYYQSIDLYVCASEAEGFSTSVMECLAMNVPVVSTGVGVPSTLGGGITRVERTMEGIRGGIRRFWTRPMVVDFTWPKVCAQFYELYQGVVCYFSLSRRTTAT